MLYRLAINNAISLNIDLKATDNENNNGLEMAEENGKTEIVNLLKRKLPNDIFGSMDKRQRLLS